jgi:hypothetical protein
MPTTTTALSSLLPLAGAVALTVQGVRRLHARRSADSGPRPLPPQPKEIPEPEKRIPRARKTVPDGTCAECGTSVPGRQTLCTPCERRHAGAANSAATTALHWLVFLAVMSAIMGAGWLVAP